MSTDWENVFISDSDDDDNDTTNEEEIDYYKVLGVSRSSTNNEIIKCYRQKARKLHPDRHRNETQKYNKLFQELSEAYSVLKDKNKREIYDKFGKRGLKTRNIFIPKTKNDLDMLFKMAFPDEGDNNNTGNNNNNNNDNDNSNIDLSKPKCKDIKVTKQISKEESRRSNITIRFEKNAICTTCIDKVPYCETCGGIGSVNSSFRWTTGPEIKKQCQSCDEGIERAICPNCYTMCDSVFINSCMICNGKDYITRICRKCKGTGKIKERPRIPMKVQCGTCKGRKRFCEWCQNKGYSKVTCNIPMKIKNIKDKQKQILKGMGNERKNYRKGDVIITYRTESKSSFWDIL